MQKNIKSEYSKPREIINEQIQNIMAILVISDANEYNDQSCAREIKRDSSRLSRRGRRVAGLGPPRLVFALKK